MKRILMAVMLLIGIGAGLLLAAPHVAQAATSANLLANPSVETIGATSASPQGWTSSKWGTNAVAFTYAAPGHTGSKSVKAQVTSYTNGDAKWYADPVSVTPGTAYTYSDYYTSTVMTHVVVQYTSASGANTYEEFATAPIASVWTQLTRVFTPPAGTQKATVFHLISAVGSLTIDDASMTYETATTTPPVTPPATTTNLVANPSFETSTGSPAQPSQWTSSKWGTNTTAFSYATDGKTGTRSAKTVMTGYANGDAKWYFTPVTVQPNTSYDISDYYKANVVTRTVMVTYDTANNPTYTDITTAVPASASTWTQTKKTMITPANAVKMTIFHLIERNGSLQIDDMSVVPTTTSTTPTPPTTPTTPTPVAVANPSVETEASATTPASWVSNSWGTNTASFQYVKNDAHQGTKSVKSTITNYTDGDAKWYPQPLTTLVPGKQYRYTVWYKSDIKPQAVVMFLKADGSESYFGMPQPYPAANASTTWQKYSETFTVPLDAVGVSPFLFVASNGFVQVDDISIESYVPVGLTRPLVTLTFDDGEEDNVATALPALQSHNLKSTQCFATQFVEGVPEGIAAVKAFKDAGHEICSHTVTHPFLTSLSTADLTTELTHSQQYLQTLTGGTAVSTFASPYGDYNEAVNTEIMKYYRSHRTVDEGFNSKDNFNIYRVRVQNMFSTTTLAQYQAWLDQAKATNTWLVLVYHRVAPTDSSDVGEYDTKQADFGPQLDKVVSSGITVKSYNDALNEIVPQL